MQGGVKKYLYTTKMIHVTVKPDAYLGSGGPSVLSGFILSLQRLRNTKNASICRTWVNEATLTPSALLTLSVSRAREDGDRGISTPPLVLAYSFSSLIEPFGVASPLAWDIETEGTGTASKSDWVISTKWKPNCYSTILLFHYLAILLFRYPAIPLYCYSTIPLSCYSTIPLYCYSTIPLFHYPAIPLSRYPAVPLSRHSTIPLFRYSTIPLSCYPVISLFNYPAIPLFRHSAIPILLN